MKWKLFCNALLITTGLFCIIGGVLFLTHLFPWFSVALLFIAVVLLIYNSMARYEDKKEDEEEEE